MKKVINTILLVVLGVSLSGCEWLYGLYFGIDGGSAYTPSVNSIMTEIAQYGCEGEVVDFFSFVVGRNMEDIISPTINIDNTYVKFDAMKKDREDTVAMGVRINGKDDVFKFRYGGDPVRGVKMESFIETVYTFGSKYDNNHSYEWNSEFFLWDAFEYKGFKCIVLSASNNINIKFYSPKGQILESHEVNKIIEDPNKVNGKDYYEISVMGAMNGVDKTAYVIDNRVYIRNLHNTEWSYFCNYSVPSSMSTNRVETMILIKVTKLSDNNSRIVSTENRIGKYYFTQTPDPRNVSRFFIAPYK